MKRLFATITTLLLMVGTAGADSAKDALDASGVKGGLVVHIGSGDADAQVLTTALRPRDGYLVHGLSMIADHVFAARQEIRSLGLYGPVSVDTWDGSCLPYGDNLVNLIVVDGDYQVAEAELLRVLAPRGVVVANDGNGWQKTLTKPWPEEMDEWNHYFHGPDGNPVADDSLVGPPRRLQWIGSPHWSRHHDHMASMTSLVSAGGRLFYIFDEGLTASIQLPSRWRLIARDAFNGTILWKRTIEQWNTRQYPLKSGPAHLLRRLAAVGDRVYVTLGIDAPVTALDAASGKTLTTFAGSEFTKEIIVSDGVVFLVAGTERSRLPDWRRLTSQVWDNRDLANVQWGWSGQTRKVLAHDAQSGERLWEAERPVAPCSLAVDGSRVVFHDGGKLVGLDRRDGSTMWESEEAPTAKIVLSNTGPRVLIYGDVVLFSGNDGKMSGWSAADGSKLWQQTQKKSGHNSLKDLFVVDGLVWTGDIAGGAQDGGTFAGYDPVTGEMKREFPIDIQLNWFHHRCYPAKAAGKYILTARNGTEFVDLEAEHWDPHHWVRGGCIYGVMPANGMMYASMDACGCQLEAKLDGFKALAPGPVVVPDAADLTAESRLEKGPAYGAEESNPSSLIPNPSHDWPTYRHDPGRSGSTATSVVADNLKQTWQARLGGRLSAPTVAAGQVYVSSINTHTIHALDDATGKPLWAYTVGGRVDSPPTCYKGLVLFGSADGYVYALRASDGQLVWRFRGAPIDRRITAWEQLESAWPVHGSVLVTDGVLYCTAGRNMYLDGGVRLIRLDPQTGRLLGEEVMNHLDPESGKGMHETYIQEMTGNNMPVALSDILSSDGKNIWMRSQKFGFDGRRREIALEDVTVQPADDAHLFCQIGFLDDSYFFRSYWTYGRRVTGGYSYWLQAGRLVPSGRILCYDDEHVYGFGRKPAYVTNSSVLEYEFFAAAKSAPPEKILSIAGKPDNSQPNVNRQAGNTSDWRARYQFPREALTANSYRWTVDQPAIICRAMVLAGDSVFFAGPPNFVNERQAFRFPDDAQIESKLERQAEALEGKHAGELWALSKQDGKLLGRYRIDSPPVFDGMAAAAGRLYTSTMDGRVLCLSENGAVDLPSIDDRPLSTAWDEPEIPNPPKPGGKRK